jgi:hypothetical protein
MCHARTDGATAPVPAGAIHSVRNAGTGNAAERATYVLEKESRSSGWSSDPAVLYNHRPATTGALRHITADDGSPVLRL